MRGSKEVIQQLSEALRIELTAVVQYAVHAELCVNWGYQRLSASIHQQAVEEMEHAERLIERILSLGGTPRVDVMSGPRHGVSVQVQLEHHLAHEVRMLGQYDHATAACAKAGDDVSRTLFERMVADELRHAEFLKSELCEIGEFGLDNYLAKQIH